MIRWLWTGSSDLGCIPWTKDRYLEALATTARLQAGGWCGPVRKVADIRAELFAEREARARRMGQAVSQPTTPVRLRRVR